jgi:lysophospholipase
MRSEAVGLPATSPCSAHLGAEETLADDGNPIIGASVQPEMGSLAGCVKTRERSGCGRLICHAHPPQETPMALIDHADNPAPEGATTGYVKAADGTKLRYARWLPVGTAKGTVVIVQGRAEFIEKYFETVRDLLARRFAVVTFDLRGQGGSERLLGNPEKGHVTDFEDYVSDIDAVLDQIVFAECPAPVFALGHSTGATALLLASVGGRSRFRRQVLISPFLGLPENEMPAGLARALSVVMSTFGFGRAYVPHARRHIMHGQTFEKNRLTTDSRRYHRNRGIALAHPELAIGAPPISWIRSAFRAMARIDAEDFAPRIRVPTLMVSAGDERVVSLGAVERFASRFKVGHLIVLPGARHEILKEQDAIPRAVLRRLRCLRAGGLNMAPSMPIRVLYMDEQYIDPKTHKNQSHSRRSATIITSLLVDPSTTRDFKNKFYRLFRNTMQNNKEPIGYIPNFHASNMDRNTPDEDKIQFLLGVSMLVREYNFKIYRIGYYDAIKPTKIIPKPMLGLCFFSIISSIDTDKYQIWPVMESDGSSSQDSAFAGTIQFSDNLYSLYGPEMLSIDIENIGDVHYTTKKSPFGIAVDCISYILDAASLDPDSISPFKRRIAQIAKNLTPLIGYNKVIELKVIDNAP